MQGVIERKKGRKEEENQTGIQLCFIGCITFMKKAPCGTFYLFCREEGIRTLHFFYFLKTLETLVSIGFDRFWRSAKC